ncbi:RNA polymerase sigma factor [Pseudomonas sp. GD04058]|uniref:RNA polymerase sigma factor n=1 Tax=Pseudomonas sp. GD04058 TaxID=2975429 RepID=UPI00244891C3|nr:RNA polymerase sigma factor [Pseudomonas sp. GD04058]MDG9882555.1 RNA polymerase sigma factor [Pseudomonas sp. GD04058]
MQADPPQPTLLSTLVRHYDELVEHIRRRFGERGFAREVVHDVCVQLLEKQEKQGIRSPLALLRKIAHDNAVGRYRGERRRQRWLVTVAELPEMEAQIPSQERQLDASQTLDRLVRAIESLPPRCQMVFVMHKLHELPQAEVAERLGISLKTVEKHLRLGMAACREYLA